MPHSILNQVSDEDLKQTYQSRFRAKFGDTINNSTAVADHHWGLVRSEEPNRSRPSADELRLNVRTTEVYAVIFLNSRNTTTTHFPFRELDERQILIKSLSSRVRKRWVRPPQPYLKKHS